jgi:hypothetical protein
MGLPTHRRLIGSGVAPPPFRVISVVALDSTHVRITFASRMLDNPPLRDPSSYEITGLGSTAGHNPRVHSVAPEVHASPIYVDLTTDEMRGGISNYRMRIHALEEA